MDSGRKQIVFDIDTKIAEKIFGSGYRKIYYHIEKVFKENGFVHVEGSVYQSINNIEHTEFSYLIDTMIEGCPGLEKCIRDARATTIVEENDINYLFQYDGTIGNYPDLSVRQYDTYEEQYDEYSL